MKALQVIIGLATGIFLLFAFCQTRETGEFFTKPKHFPDPKYDFASNPLTVDGIALGKALFYDAALSKDNTISCGSCHQQSSGFTQHGHALSHGVDDLLTQRNSMPIQNMAWHTQFGWDGGIPHLDVFSISPLQKENEMGETLSNVLDKLRNTEPYPEMFRKAFGSPQVSTDRFLKALSQFMLTMVSANSRYDLYTSGNNDVLSPIEKEGLKVFRQKCSSCHSGELFTDFSFRNNGLSNPDESDTGREAITLDKEDKYKFRVPSLRNIVITFPYMHNGSIETLEEVLEHYSEKLQTNEHTDPLLKNRIPLTSHEKHAVLAFLNSLTDETFLQDPRFAESTSMPSSNTGLGITDWTKTNFGKLAKENETILTESIAKYWLIYNGISEKNGQTASARAGELVQILRRWKSTSLTPLQYAFSSSVYQLLLFDAEHIEETKDYKHQLDHFGDVGLGLYKLCKAFSVPAKAYFYFCGQANRGNGGYWLQPDSITIRNPFPIQNDEGCGILKDTF